MKLRGRYLIFVAIFDLVILFFLFPTPVRFVASIFFDVSDGAHIINISLFFLLVNFVFFFWWLYLHVRGFFNGSNSCFFYFSLFVIFLYMVIGFYALYQMYIVGLV